MGAGSNTLIVKAFMTLCVKMERTDASYRMKPANSEKFPISFRKHTALSDMHRMHNDHFRDGLCARLSPEALDDECTGDD